ncbi:acyl--CoA ligase, partial [Candidatus Saccharibacteria bacterium]|nr:acyl--CoA ligase [Candidatus Saccharibacteria bacterium]
NGYFGNPALLPQTPGEPICSTLPPTWLTGAVNCGLIQPISGYHTIAESRYDIETVIDTIIRYKCTRWFAAQSQILNIIKRPDLVKRLIQESDLALIYNGGEPMYMSRVALYSNALSDAETQRQIGLFTAYGMTEIASIVGVPVFDAPPDPAYPNLLWYSPMSHIVVRATDPLTGQEMPLGSVGMMQIEKNPCSFTDYAGDPELTKNAWSDDGRWFNTGDATIIRQLKDADGNEHTLFAACGRYDFSFTDPNGNKHWSFEAESVIQSCPNVLDVVVVTDRDNPHGAAAHVVISGGSDTESVKAAVSAALAGLSYKVRTEFYDDLLPVKNRAKRDIRFLQQQC